MGDLWQTRFSRQHLHVFHLAITNAFPPRTDNDLFESIKKKSEMPMKAWELEHPTPGTQVFVQNGLKLGGA